MKRHFGLRNILISAAAFLSMGAAVSMAEQPRSESRLRVDSDHDGLTDTLEQALLEQFRPRFMIAEHDCSAKPAEFRTGVAAPEVQSDNGTIYGQVFPAKSTGGVTVGAEIHYYHLWRKDCGDHGHLLDTEHVATIVGASDTNLPSASWKPLYWYAAAHENTICDVSQIARASTLNAEDHGARV